MTSTTEPQGSTDVSTSEVSESSEPHDINVKLNIEIVRARIKSELESVSSKSLKDLSPSSNRDFAFRIILKNPNQLPIRCTCRRIAWHMKPKVKTALDQQLEAGLIRRSTSRWCFPLKAVEKEDGTIRITVDYQKLNELIMDENYPMASVADLYCALQEADTFSRIDLTSAYHQLPVHEDSIEYTAFTCEFGTFEYLVMPMGIKTAPAWFQRFMEHVLQKYIEQNVLKVYMDDNFLFTHGLEAHLNIALEIINTLKLRSLKASEKKSIVAVEEIEILGHVVSKGKIRPKPQRSECFKTTPRPRTLLEMQIWLGIANYYRNFIKDYANIAAPLYALTNSKDLPKKFRKKMEQQMVKKSNSNGQLRLKIILNY